MARTYRSFTVGLHEFSERGVPFDLKVYHTTILSCDLQVDVFRAILKHLDRVSHLTPWAFSHDNKMDISGMRLVILYIRLSSQQWGHIFAMLPEASSSSIQCVSLCKQRRLGETGHYTFVRWTSPGIAAERRKAVLSTRHLSDRL